MKKYFLLSFPILLAWAFCSGLFWPWFEYSVTRNSPRWLQIEQTQEWLRIYQFGPDGYPRLENLDTNGCYTTITSFMLSSLSAPPTLSPFRLHRVTLTAPQVDQLRFLRLIGLLLFATNVSLNLIFCGVSAKYFIAYLRGLHLRWYKYGALVIGCVILIGIYLFGILLAVGAIVSTGVVNGFSDPLPEWQSCGTMPPPETYYDLAKWELNHIFYSAPGLMILNLALTVGAIILWQKRIAFET